MVSWVLVEENLTLAAGVLIDISTLFFFHMITGAGLPLASQLN
jgi:hypothetical protein